MKVINNNEDTINIILPGGKYSIKSGEIADLPAWAYRMLKGVYPRLEIIEEEVLVSEGEQIVTPEPEKKPEPKKAVKVKKARK